MALSGLDIYKLLPKTNCKKCGFQTCLAFAMQLAKKAVSLDKCPLISDEVRATLEEASLPAIRLVEIGSGETKVSVGRETVLFRHEEKFHHPTAVGFIVEDSVCGAELEETFRQIEALRFERVGELIRGNLVALKQTGPDSRFVEHVRLTASRLALPLVLMASSARGLKEALLECAGRRPLAYCDNPTQAQDFVSLCREFKVPLALRAASLEEFSQTTKKITASGFFDLVLDIPPLSLADRLWLLTQVRRLAIKKGDRSLGFPTMAITGASDAGSVAEASAYLTKYASIILLRSRRPEHILPLLTLRQNIYTDPQKPLQVEPKVYAVGAASVDSPVLITTNFSLTYYTVLGEIESSRVPSHLVCMDTEGMSVLTAWAAEKFNAEKISGALGKFKLSEIVRHKNLIIPGYVAMMSGDLEEQSGWRVIVGPREASGLPSFLRNLS
ncbi:MAG: acetyl-CoA decarbonylase/synthase complex subunit gamma [Candidatus Omnitrophota bacterium]